MRVNKSEISQHLGIPFGTNTAQSPSYKVTVYDSPQKILNGAFSLEIEIFSVK